MKKIRMFSLLALTIMLIFGCSGPLETVDQPESLQANTSRSTASFSPRVSKYTTVTSGNKYLSSGHYEVSVNTMNPRPNTTVRILKSNGSSVVTYFVRNNTNTYKLYSLAEGNYKIQISNNQNEDLFIGVSIKKIGGTSSGGDDTPPNDDNSSVSYSPRVAPHSTATSGLKAINSGYYNVSINTMNPSPYATIRILKSSGSSIATYYVRNNTNTYKLNISSTGDYKIQITNNQNEDLYIGVSLK